MKGYPYPEAVQAVCSIKKVIIAPIKKLITKKSLPFWGILAFIFFLIPPLKRYLFWKLLEVFIEIAQNTLSYHLLIEDKHCTVCREMFQAHDIYLKDRFKKEKHDLVSKFIHTWIMIFEYDDAYRYRFQDILSQTDKKALRENSRKEILRIIIYAIEHEEDRGLRDRMRKIKWILQIFLLFNPRLTKEIAAYIYCLRKENIELDDIDRYFAYRKHYFKFDNLSLDERKKVWTTWFQEGL